MDGMTAPSKKETTKAVELIFGEFQGEMDTETQDRDIIRETTKQIERHSKKIETIWLRIHQEPCITEVCTSIREILVTQVKPLYVELETKVPPGKSFVYLDLWRHTTRRLIGSCCLIYYLESEALLSYEEAAAWLGLQTYDKEPNVNLELEEYLFGVLELTNVLSRYSTNSVTQGDYARPAKIGKFLNEVNNGFRLLNLKNDQLRKSYDKLKWDLKKVEDVIYDVSIRDLYPGAKKVGEAATASDLLPVVTSATASMTLTSSPASADASVDQIKPEDQFGPL